MKLSEKNIMIRLWNQRDLLMEKYQLKLEIILCHLTTSSPDWIISCQCSKPKVVNIGWYSFTPNWFKQIWTDLSWSEQIWTDLNWSELIWTDLNCAGHLVRLQMRMVQHWFVPSQPLTRTCSWSRDWRGRTRCWGSWRAVWCWTSPWSPEPLSKRVAGSS